MANIESPCINVCVLDPVTGLCSGCGRTLAEISAWSTMRPEQRRAVMDRLARAEQEQQQQ